MIESSATASPLLSRGSSGFVYLRAALFSALLLIVTFADVIFLGTTVSNSAGHFASSYGLPMASLYPERQGRKHLDGYNDTGGAVWQSDPMRRYMYHVLQGRESFYWNPYSATGALGPETLVDQKASPLTLLAAALGGDQASGDVALLFFLFCSLFALYLTVTLIFGLSDGAAVAAALGFLLNGFSIANLGSNVSHAYVLFPILLYSATLFAQHPTLPRFAFAVLANSLVLATTFLPVSFLTVLSIYVLVSAYTWASAGQSTRPRLLRALRVLAALGAAVVLAVLLLAPLYFPIIESLSLLDSVRDYSQREFYPVSLHNLIGFFSPKHFWESYQAIDPELLNPTADGVIPLGNHAFHFGITASVLALLGVAARRSGSSLVHFAAAALFCLAIGRIYGIPPVSEVVQAIYGLRSLGCQYWWTMVAVAFPILMAFGFQALGEHRNKTKLLVLTFGLVVTAFVFAWEVRGWVPERWKLQLGYLGFALVVALSAAWFVRGAQRRVDRAQSPGVWAAAILLLVFAELTFYMNHLRPARNDDQLVPPGLVKFLRANLGNQRLANFGFIGLPPEYGSAYRIPEVGSMNMSILPWYMKLFEEAFMLPTPRVWGNFASLHFPWEPLDIDDQLVDMLAVKYLFVPHYWKDVHEGLLARCYPTVYSDQHGTVYLNSNAYPRVYATRALLSFEQRQSGPPTGPCACSKPGPLVRRTGSDSQNDRQQCRLALVDDPGLIEAASRLGITGSPTERAQCVKAEIDITSLRGSKVSFQIALDTSAVVVIADAWHPNWRTTVDGTEVYTGRVNGALRGIAVPAGSHRVEMRYRPRSLTAALTASGTALVLLCSLFIHRATTKASRRKHSFR